MKKMSEKGHYARNLMREKQFQKKDNNQLIKKSSMI